MNCPFCIKELGSFELEHSHKWHHECQICYYCKSQVTHEIAEKSIETNSTSIESLASSLYHLPCRDKALMEEFKIKDFPLVQANLDSLNKFLLSSREEIPLTLDQLYPLLRDLQQAAANVSIALNRKKDKIKIKDADIYRKTVEIREENHKAEKRSVEEKKARLQAERLDPKLRDRRKAIEGAMVAFNMTETQVLDMWAKAKQEKVQ